MDALSGVFLFFGFVVVIFILSVIFGSFFTVQTAQVALVQRLGKLRAWRGRG
jgi:regulator of protease activity HflC (stomatin/prohibitin superfamily)